MRSADTSTSRRNFLKFLAGSPLLAFAAPSFAHETPSRLPDPMTWAPRDMGEPIKSPRDAINVFDFEPAAYKNVPPAHFGYMASGIDDEVTLRANREAFNRLVLRPRRLVDVTNVDPGIELFGVKWETPIIIAPTGGNRAFHADGELAVARAAKARRHLQILSTSASTSVDDVTKERGMPIWFQLYASPSWDVAKALVGRAEAAGCPVVALTVDRVAGRNQETFLRLRKIDARVCSDCHGTTIQDRARTRPNYDGIDLSALKRMESSNLTWDFVRRLRDATRMKLVIKGILTAEDAKLCVENGVDGVIVSNHGGRGEDSGGATIDFLPEVVQAVSGRIPVLVDSGFRRGTDLVKALAIGANAECIGRPYLWGLGAFGQAGVERVLELMRAELEVAMRQSGVRSVKELTPAFVRKV
ncbi:MAG TPA: alpha-hydroxy acid oxidase [Xanthobacteraceae bacterium]|nr:alpha-hydroxy acid oxidase [Xanthobacteraceae bacterium]